MSILHLWYVLIIRFFLLLLGFVCYIRSSHETPIIIAKMIALLLVFYEDVVHHRYCHHHQEKPRLLRDEEKTAKLSLQTIHADSELDFISLYHLQYIKLSHVTFFPTIIRVFFFSFILVRKPVYISLYLIQLYRLLSTMFCLNITDQQITSHHQTVNSAVTVTLSLKTIHHRTDLKAIVSLLSRRLCLEV